VSALPPHEPRDDAAAPPGAASRGPLSTSGGGTGPVDDEQTLRELMAWVDERIATYPPDLRHSIVSLLDPIVGLDAHEKRYVSGLLRAVGRSFQQRDPGEDQLAALTAAGALLRKAAEVVDAASAAARGEGDLFVRARAATSMRGFTRATATVPAAPSTDRPGEHPHERPPDHDDVRR
jgi:hypothetical protein